MFAAHDDTNLQISSEPEKPPAIVNLFLECHVCVCVCVCVCEREREREREVQGASERKPWHFSHKFPSR